MVGKYVGESVGSVVGESVGWSVGKSVGKSVGWLVGGGATSMRAAEVETAEAVGVEADGTILYVLQLDLDEQARDLP